MNLVVHISEYHSEISDPKTFPKHKAFFRPSKMTMHHAGLSAYRATNVSCCCAEISRIVGGDYLVSTSQINCIT